MTKGKGAARMSITRIGITRILGAHFFRRFFDNDTLQAEGDTLTTVIRALSIVAVPSLMFAFFLQNAYPYRALWAAIQDKYFFVLYSFVVMGAVSIFEWEMLFPDRLDFLVLSPLPLRPVQMLAAKAAALGAFLGLFLLGSNLLGTLLLPLLSKGMLFRQFYAHGVAVMAAGLFATLSNLALGGVLLCVLGAAGFRAVSPLLQVLSTMALVLLALHFVLYGDSLQALLTGNLHATRFVPTLWFLGLYEHLLHGDAAPPFTKVMTHYAARGLFVAALAAVFTYPVAWARMQKAAAEGGAQQRPHAGRRFVPLVHALVRRPQERAVYHFISQTIARNNRYQLYLAMYCGTGLALATTCAVGLRGNGASVQAVLSERGLHAVMPLLLFWIVAGLRTAFAFPLQLPAAWVFRVTGVDVRCCAQAARRWAMVCALCATGGILAALLATRWNAKHLLVQMVWGLCLAVLLTDGFFFLQRGAPFTRPRMPGKTSLPLMLTLYVGVLPLFILGVAAQEQQMEEHLPRMFLLIAGTVLIHCALLILSGSFGAVEEEIEGYEGEFQVLGLSAGSSQ